MSNGTCHHCGAQFQRASSQDTKSNCCPKPECQQAKLDHLAEMRKIYNGKHYRLYQKRRDKRRNKPPKPKKDRRVCRGQHPGCKTYIDNENRWFCSVCHKIVSHSLADPDWPYGGGYDQNLSDEKIMIGR